MGRKIYVKSFILGYHYDLYVGNLFYKQLKLIKVTNKGYNFLDETNNKVVFTKHHFYRNTYYGMGDDTRFNLTLPTYIRVTKIISNEKWESPLNEDLSIKVLKKGQYWVRSPRFIGELVLYYSPYTQTFSGWDRDIYYRLSVLEVSGIQRDLIQK